jgi:hypothetical protein
MPTLRPRRRALPLLVGTLLALSLTLPSAALPARAAAAQGRAEQCFAQTGKCVAGPFLDYWLANGGLAQQGLPLTDEFMEISPLDGKPYRVQYFERARFEHHPENDPPYRVLLGLLGLEQYRARYAAPPTGNTDPFGAGAECAPFENGLRVCGAFLAYWRANGGLAQQGLPLTDLFAEVNPSNGREYVVQYFERARFEWHPESADPRYQVLLGLLGREQFSARYPGGQSAPAAPSPRVVATGHFEQKGHMGGGGVSIVVGADGAATVRFADNFTVQDGPLLLVYLTVEPSPDSREEVERGYLDLGPLQALGGAQDYPIPPGTDLGRYNGVLVYCVEFHVPFLAAPLTRP